MDGKTCSKCPNVSLPNHRYCRECRNAYMREHRPKYGELTDVQKLKASARAIAKIYENRGVLRRPSMCQHCRRRKVKLERHHADYSKPLAVVWLCKDCHREADASNVSRPTMKNPAG